MSPHHMFYHITARSTYPTCNSLELDEVVVVGVLEAHKQMQSCVPVCKSSTRQNFIWFNTFTYVYEILRVHVSHYETMHSHFCSNRVTSLMPSTINIDLALFSFSSFSPVKLTRGNGAKIQLGLSHLSWIEEACTLV